MQKSHLRKLLAQIQRDIEKLIREKNYKILRRKKSLHRAKWVNNSNEQKPSSNRVIRGKNSVRFFIRRDRIDRKLLQSVLSNDHLIDDERLLMISKLAKANEHDAINNDDDCKQEQKNEETLADQDSDHSSSLEDQSSTQQSCSHDRKDCDVGQIGKMMLDKEDFIKMLQLVHKNDLEKMANCKKPRKRRTTANPQFSHAAIEAKRITKMEIANERRHRRRIALEKHHNKPCEPTNLNDLLKSMNVFKQTNEMFPGNCAMDNKNNFMSITFLPTKQACSA